MGDLSKGRIFKVLIHTRRYAEELDEKSLVDARRGFCRDAVGIALGRKVDFVDAYHFLTMRTHEIEEIYWFPEIKRLENVKS